MRKSARQIYNLPSSPCCSSLLWLAARTDFWSFEPDPEQISRAVLIRIYRPSRRRTSSSSLSTDTVLSVLRTSKSVRFQSSAECQTPQQSPSSNSVDRRVFPQIRNSVQQVHPESTAAARGRILPAPACQDSPTGVFSKE